MVLNNFIKDRLLSSARSQIKKYIKKRVLTKLPDDKVSFIERDGSITIRTTTEFADDSSGFAVSVRQISSGIV